MRWLYTLLTIIVSVVIFGSFAGKKEQGQTTQRAASAQQVQPRKKYMDEGLVEHKPNSATLKVNDPRPLNQAISTLNEEYGWTIDYEDPPYMSDVELIDITDPKRRAANPNDRVTIPAGDGFQFDYDEDQLIAQPEREVALLHTMVAAYNRSGNPGRFVVREEEKGRYTIIGSIIKNHAGQDQDISPVLDTQISIPVENRVAIDTLQLILKELSAKSNTKVAIGSVPANLLFNTRVTVGGANASARSLILRTFNATGRPLTYSLFYFEDTQRYLLRATVAVRAHRDTYGRKTLIPLDSRVAVPR